MIKNHKQYRITCGQMNELNKSIHDYKEKVNADKDNLELKTQLDAFNGQLDEVYQELRAYEQRKEFRKHAKAGDNEKVSEMSFENPLLKQYLSREQLIRLSDYYEKGINEISLELLKTDNRVLKDLSTKLKNTLGSLENK